MSVEQTLFERSESACELCGSKDALEVYEVQPAGDGSADAHALICENCKSQIKDPSLVEANHWRCLNNSMWNTTPAVQVLVWRMLTRLRAEGWPQDLLDMMYLEDDVLTWAKADGTGASSESGPVHRDSNGVTLESGDTVVLIKDLDVKGAGFTAKRGTAVRRISLVHDNPEHIEGRVNGQQIVILTKFVKKS